MNILNEVDEQVEQARYRATVNLFTFLSLVLLLLGIINLIQWDINMYPMFVGAACAGTVLIFVNRTKKYRYGAIAAVFFTFLLNIYNFSVASNFGHVIDCMWVIIMSIYTFFTLGMRWGVGFTTVNCLVVILIFTMEFLGVITRVEKETSDFSHINFAINFTVTIYAFCYILVLMIKSLRVAAENYRLSNEQLQETNEEKTVMLKEIHHRVKNNLQVIMSLLRLQSHEVKDEEARHHFGEAVNRVSAMAMIHEKMYQSQKLSKINLQEYLDSLVANLIQSYSANAKIIREIDSNIEEIQPKSLVPLALIFNELVSNSIEHAFHDKTEGRIKITALQKEGDKVLVTYSDNGNWEAPKGNSFGLELVESFTDQLDGTFARNIDTNGTHYTFEFHTSL